MEKTASVRDVLHAKSPKISLSKRLFPTGLSVCTLSRFSITRLRERPRPFPSLAQVNYILMCHIIGVYIYIYNIYTAHIIHNTIIYYVYNVAELNVIGFRSLRITHHRSAYLAPPYLYCNCRIVIMAYPFVRKT